MRRSDSVIHPPFDCRRVPRLDEPAKISGFTLLLAIVCSCGAKEPIGLMNAQKAVCEGCGRVFHANSITWDKTHGISNVDITASLSRQEVIAQS